MTRYNYENFSSKDYDFDTSSGPVIGQKAPDFELATSDGETRRLLDFEGDLLVLELGSITCPLFQSRRGTMSDLAETYENVENAVLYVREAHPGAQIPAHRDFDEKRACAKRLATEDKEARLVLVDDVKGTAHQAFGGMPNSVFIVNRNGCVLYKSDWNNPSATKAALEALLDDHPVRAKSYFRPALPTVVFRTLKRAGKGSGPDFFRSLPSLIWNNLVKRNIRLLFGRPETAARDTTC